MHESLESLFRIWYNFTDENHWKIIMKENDLDQSGNCLGQNNHSINDGSDELPHRMNRLIVGLFYLPLDSIERYYGEKVAFYFAWLQHCSTKLIFPSILGVIVTLIQAWTQQWEDNKVLPIFSVRRLHIGIRKKYFNVHLIFFLGSLFHRSSSLWFGLFM